MKAMLLPGADQEEMLGRQDKEMSIQTLIPQVLKLLMDRGMEFLWESREARILSRHTESLNIVRP